MLKTQPSALYVSRSQKQTVDTTSLCGGSTVRYREHETSDEEVKIGDKDEKNLEDAEKDSNFAGDADLPEKENDKDINNGEDAVQPDEFRGLLETVRGRGQESTVYLDGDHVIKNQDTLQSLTLQEALDEITLFNTLFPGTAKKVIGFGRDKEGS